MFLKKLTGFLLLILAVHFASAHAIWIETNTTGKKGAKQELRVYFGEFSDKDITKAAEWFSDLKDFTLTVIAPDKTETELSSTAAADHYASSFVPTQNGVYTIAVKHAVKDVYNKMKLVYHTSATVVVGNEFTGNNALINQNFVSLFSDSAYAAKVNRSVGINAINNNAPAQKQEVEVVAPNGWAKKLYVDEKGQVRFTPLWAGKYMAEFSYSEKTPGEQNGKPYEQVYNIATYIIQVK